MDPLLAALLADKTAAAAIVDSPGLFAKSALVNQFITATRWYGFNPPNLRPSDTFSAHHSSF